MSPRALTEREKENQRQRLVRKGRDLLIARGVRGISVDDVTRAAGMAKGSFYLHFPSKEVFLFALIKDIQEQSLHQAEQMILESQSVDLRARLRQFIQELFQQPEYLFFAREHEYLDELLADVLHDQVQLLKELECANYDRLLRLAGIDTQRVQAAVVINCIHAIFTGVYGNPVLIDDYIAETLDVLIEGLVHYIARDEA